MEGWDEIASKAVQAAFLRDVCQGMSKPHEWGDHTKLCMRFALKMYAQGYAAGMERAAVIVKNEAAMWTTMQTKKGFASDCAHAIRAEIKDQS
ncbi:hypothetical protein LMG26411_00570 [Cupriavidus numazuensis]|uniref:Uncharacterized protein n=2 Tax=Cupriavidus numazuensis TaxID=221992 RepID=A0ABN7PWR3_9BURK|nr:hypothetical protein LMG26411_00570 [Cupriavidus numazuensis]